MKQLRRRWQWTPAASVQSPRASAGADAAWAAMTADAAAAAAGLVVPRQSLQPDASAAGNGAAASSSSSAAATVTDTPPLPRRFSLRLNPPRAHAKLHRHALESIFAFLSFDELRSVMLVKKEWMIAVSTMRGLVKGKLLQGDRSNVLLLPATAPSRLTRHVTYINGAALTRAQVEQIAHRMPFLQTLHFEVQVGCDWSQPMRLPSTLHSIGLMFHSSCSIVYINEVIAAFSQHPQLTSLMLTSLHDPAEPVVPLVSFAPLRSLSPLRELRVWNSGNLPFALSAQQVEEIRALTQLQQLRWWIDRASLLQLLQPLSSGALQWIELPPNCTITAEMIPLLLQLPQLHTFNFASVSPSLSSLDFLAQMPSLKEIHVEYGFKNDILSARDALLSTLSVTLSNVTELRIGGSNLHTQKFRSLLTHFPQLRELTLSICTDIDSLSFLDPVRSTLCSLELLYCWRLHPSPAETEALTPPSTLIPTLKHFRYIQNLRLRSELNKALLCCSPAPHFASQRCCFLRTMKCAIFELR